MRKINISRSSPTSTPSSTATSAIVRGVNVISDRKGTEVLRIRFTDVLRFTGGHWLAVAAQETDQGH